MSVAKSQLLEGFEGTLYTRPVEVRNGYHGINHSSMDGIRFVIKDRVCQAAS